MSSESNGDAGQGIDAFQAFLHGWMLRQQHFLEQLLSAQRNFSQCSDCDLEGLASRVLAHYRDYYAHKSRAAHRNVFRVFSPSWLTPLELSFFWIAGINPALALRLATSTTQRDEELSEEQRVRIGQLWEETKAAERKLSEELARMQESVATPPCLEMARRAGWGGEGITGVDAAVETLRAAAEGLVSRADTLRMRTVDKVVEILRPRQKVSFLAAAAQLHLRIRELGLASETRRRRDGH